MADEQVNRNLLPVITINSVFIAAINSNIIKCGTMFLRISGGMERNPRGLRSISITQSSILRPSQSSRFKTTGGRGGPNDVMSVAPEIERGNFLFCEILYIFE